MVSHLDFHGMKWPKWPVWRWFPQATTVLGSPRHVCWLYQWFAKCIPIVAPHRVERLKAPPSVARHDPKCSKSRTKSTSWVKGSRDRWATFSRQKFSAIVPESLFEIQSEIDFILRKTHRHFWDLVHTEPTWTAVMRIWRHLETSWCQASSARAVAKAGLSDLDFCSHNRTDPNSIWLNRATCAQLPLLWHGIWNKGVWNHRNQQRPFALYDNICLVKIVGLVLEI